MYKIKIDLWLILKKIIKINKNAKVYVNNDHVLFKLNLVFSSIMNTNSVYDRF